VTRSQGRGSSGDLVLQQFHCLLMDSPSICGLAWRTPQQDCMVVTVASVGAVHTYDLAAHMQHLLVLPRPPEQGGGGGSEEVAAKAAERARQQALALKNAKSLSFWEGKWHLGCRPCSFTLLSGTLTVSTSPLFLCMCVCVQITTPLARPGPACPLRAAS
jgi:hypothetical protein